MSKKENSDHIEVEESTDETSMLVVDPDDYQKTKKLKRINESKKHYKELKRNEHERKQVLKDMYTNWREAYDGELAEAIADYASELLPLIEEGVEHGSLSEEDCTVQVMGEGEEITMKQVASYQGRLPFTESRDVLSGPGCDNVYRQLEKVEQKLGLGLELEENKGPAQI